MFGAIAKLARGTLGPDELALLFEQLGMDVKIGEVPRSEFKAAFGAAGEAAANPSSKMVRFSGVDKIGGKIEGVFILVQQNRLSIGDQNKT